MNSMRIGCAVGLWVVLSADASSASPRVYPPNCTVPTRISLVGTHAGAPDGAGSFTVVVRDLTNNPTNGASVVVDLSNCTDLALCSDQSDPAALVNCVAKTTRKFTNITGSVSFTVLGGSNGSGNASTLLNGARIYANGIPIGSPTASAFDLDGSHGVGINDLSVWLTDFATAGSPPFGRSDFDGDGSLGINDLSVWVTAFGAGGSVAGCAASCP